MLILFRLGFPIKGRIITLTISAGMYLFNPLESSAIAFEFARNQHLHQKLNLLR